MFLRGAIIQPGRTWQGGLFSSPSLSNYRPSCLCQRGYPLLTVQSIPSDHPPLVGALVSGYDDNRSRTDARDGWATPLNPLPRRLI